MILFNIIPAIKLLYINNSGLVHLLVVSSLLPFRLVMYNCSELYSDVSEFLYP